ncbi:MAG TPA: TonB C-terminal domain-containing protein [Candidatus Acidoferrum sp.]|nr:TonB C-terminal domain-containing protein [Candidatus Acidoferrum sp.]
MLPQSHARTKRNSSRVNLLISFLFHALIVLTMFYFAARQGLLGKQLKKIAVEMVKEKPPEKPKEPEKPKVEPPKVEPPKVVEKPRLVEEAKAAPPPPVVAPPTVAPPAAELPAFEFEGGKAVETSSDPVQLYKGFVEYALRSRWQRPDNIADDNYVAEVEVSVDRKGRLSDPTWEKGSGDRRWDDSVRQALATVKSLDRPPPTNFPGRVVVRFDVQAETEPISQ